MFNLISSNYYYYYYYYYYYLFIYILSKNYLIHQIVAQSNLYIVLYVCIGSYVFFPVLANVSVFKAKRLAQRTSIAKKIYLLYGPEGTVCFPESPQGWH